MTTDLAGWIEATRAWADGALDELVPSAETHPARLHEALRYAVFGGGKRLRPAVVRLCCEGLGGSLEDARRPAVALELVHTYSLVHDDLPCMDDDALRRGRPTVHVAYDEALAVLVGDALQTLAFELLAEAPQGAAMVGVLARAAGPSGMVGGQVLDLALELAEAPDVELVSDMHRRKTAALFQAAAELGALAAGADEATRARAAAFGEALGLMFQAVDDVLDVTGDASTLGKTPGKDAALERVSLVTALGEGRARSEAERCAQEARALAWTIGWQDEGRAEALIEFLLQRQA